MDRKDEVGKEMAAHIAHGIARGIAIGMALAIGIVLFILLGGLVVQWLWNWLLPDIFGLRPGDANVLRNAGAVATDDVIRSLVLSQRVLGTREVVVLGHTGCGLHRLREDRLRADLAIESGAPVEITFGAFDDIDDHVRRQVARLAEHPLILDVPVHGLVYEVETGRVRPVSG